MIVAIDPGISGGLAVIHDNLDIEAQPFDENKYLKILRTIPPGTEVHIEKVSSMPGQGVKSMFTFGRNFGWCEGVCRANNLSVVHVPPKQWQKRWSLKKEKGESQYEWKDRLRRKARSIFPMYDLWYDTTISFQRAICDALLIAAYAHSIRYGELYDA